jgi:hypothetical protein
MPLSTETQADGLGWYGVAPPVLGFAAAWSSARGPLFYVRQDGRTLRPRSREPSAGAPGLDPLPPSSRLACRRISVTNLGLISPLFHEGAQNLWATPLYGSNIPGHELLANVRSKGLRYLGKAAPHGVQWHHQAPWKSGFGVHRLRHRFNRQHQLSKTNVPADLGRENALGKWLPYGGGI